MADRELAKMVSNVSKGNVATTGERLDIFLDRWIEHLEAIGHSPVYIREARYKADKIIKPELGAVRINRLTARHLDALYYKMTARGLKPRTVRTVHAILQQLLATGGEVGPGRSFRGPQSDSADDPRRPGNGPLA